MLSSLIFCFLFQTSSGTITGKLIDYNSHDPIVGARIVLQKTEYKTKTDKEGKFTFANIPPGTYQLLILDSHYPSGGPKGITVNRDSTSKVQYSMMKTIGYRMEFLEADTSKPADQ